MGSTFIQRLVCVQCGAACQPGQRNTCPHCGPDEGILDVEFDLRRAARTFTAENLRRRTRSHWRYRELLPLDEANCPTDGLVGWTPVVEAPRLAKELGIGRLRLKNEGLNPSGSFKDRPSSVAVAHAMQQGAGVVACASTGNAASSLACSAAMAGLKCNIFVARFCPEGKLAQLLAYGARVFRVQGTYEQAYELCNACCREYGWYNRNAAINPYLVEGKKTAGLEIAEQCASDPPQWVSCSIGDGCSIAGVHKGISSMHRMGLIDWSTRMLGVQAEGVAPVAQALETGRLDRSGAGHTYADSINVPVPRNWRKAVSAVRDSNGTIVTASDTQIMEAVRLTGRLAGVFAEPAAAAAISAVAVARQRSVLDGQSDVLALITGNGLKDVAGAIRAVGEPHDIAPSMNAVRAIVEAKL